MPSLYVAASSPPSKPLVSKALQQGLEDATAALRTVLLLTVQHLLTVRVNQTCPLTSITHLAQESVKGLQARFGLACTTSREVPLSGRVVPKKR